MAKTDVELRFASTRLETGPRLHYAEQRDRGGMPVVFVHGWPDSWYSFSRVLSLLPGEYHAFAVDQRGFGDSERPRRGYAIDDFADDCSAFLDAIEIDTATLVGHSMGSFVARRVAETHPSRVDRLVLIGSAVTANNEVTRELLAVVETLEDPLDQRFAREFEASTIHHPVPESFLDGIVAESLKAPAYVWRSAFEELLADHDADELESITAPTLILWGEQDALFSLMDQEQLALAIADVRLTVYPATGHCPNWERPERVSTDLHSFLHTA